MNLLDYKTQSLLLKLREQLSQLNGVDDARAFLDANYERHERSATTSIGVTHWLTCPGAAPDDGQGLAIWIHFIGSDGTCELLVAHNQREFRGVNAYFRWPWQAKEQTG